MSHYVAFPAHLVAELLAFLPADERPVYAERFERIVGDLVWVKADAENAVETALAESDAPEVVALHLHADLRQTLTEQLMDRENDALTALVQDDLATMAADLLREWQVAPARRNA